jgi:dTDP-4-dehydrorhamnose 3,5-epimerase-like enzyme
MSARLADAGDARPTVSDCRVMPLPHHADARGSLTVLERSTELPFEVRRTFIIAGVPPGAVRGQHANLVTTELLVCAAGAVTVRVEDGRSTRSIPLSPTGGAVLVPPSLWIELYDFAPGTALVVLADTDYRVARDAYIRDRARWLATRGVSRVA